MNRKHWVWSRGRRFMVSTIRLLVDHGHGQRPLWYETMVFETYKDGVSPAPINMTEHSCERYRTAKEARAGHNATLANLRARDLLP